MERPNKSYAKNVASYLLVHSGNVGIGVNFERNGDGALGSGQHGDRAARPVARPRRATAVPVHRLVVAVVSEAQQRLLVHLPLDALCKNTFNAHVTRHITVEPSF